ncbi:glycosyltransferase family 4 protein [uncultured Roseovarius sp.]|uniref:glycosyltransferase family 4 protein n=1 Tax=uncultured Roseovarius sp. TaxID=293344 RepID=UPI000C4FBCCF|nr:glycosyl transferase family 1 [Roseovarius sp.]MBD13273.1 glycosyl transferase family 1 [Roseovarius sp.]|tara:strand:- start:14 stop:1078 length:1065 start_codon:yes stop_codon:yes gene_type:complete
MAREAGRALAFAVPGDPELTTGGYLYDRRLAEALVARGIRLRHLRLGDSFPHPDARDMADALAHLGALPRDCPALVDGLAYGALDPDGVARLAAPMVALVHHPLALEPGLSAPQAQAMAARERANLSRARHIVVTSGHIAGLLQETYGVAPERISVARPGFVAPNLRPVPEVPPLVLSVGLLARRKGHDVLLRALARITDLDWRAVIVGRLHEPETVAALHALRAEMGLAERVEIAGEISQPALEALYGRATLFALATRYEGYGIVFDEAMGHGLPIISTLAGAVPETVAPGAGILVPPEDDAAFGEALRRMLNEPALRAGCASAARQAAAALGDWAAAAQVVADAVRVHTSAE